MKSNHISVCICTFKRPEYLRRLLLALEQQQAVGFTFSAVICDNDASRSAASTVSEFARCSSLPVRYCSETRQNIALARNRTIENAEGDYIAFIDDDEFPTEHWLVRLWEACHRFQCAGVLGPVLPHFDTEPPRWIIRGGFCERPEYPTGKRLDWDQCRTGNVLFKRSILCPGMVPFHESFGTAGEDMNFFWRMIAAGNVFVWCHEAVVYETVPPHRWKRTFLIKRALLRGSNAMKHPAGRKLAIAKSLVAVPGYLLLIPLVSLFGQHLMMKYLVKWFDHASRLFAACGIRIVKERET